MAFSENNNIKVLSYNVHSSQSLANLHLKMEVYRPSVVLLQEVKISSEQLASLGRRMGYAAVTNVDD